MRILIAEDDQVLADGLLRALRSSGAAVDHVTDGAQADSALMTNTEFDLLILDLGLPKLHGLEVLKRLRGRGSSLQVLILTAADSVDERVKGLDYGADDYMAKPFALEELEARVRALTRRTAGSASTLIKHGPLTYDQSGRVATLEGKMIDLSAREISLLEILLSRSGRLVSKDQLVERLCEWGEEVSNNAIEVYIHRLRKKIEKGPIRIATVRGLGYCLEKSLLNLKCCRALKIFQPEQRSLFGEILDWMLTPLLVIWPASLVLTWLVAQSIASGPFDRALEYNAQVLSQLVSVQQGRAQFNLPAPAREILRADETDLVYYQVLGLRGEYLSGERELPLPPEDDVAETGRVKLRDEMFRGEEVRIAWLYTRAEPTIGSLKPDSKPILIQVAETREKRARLATEIVKGVMLPQFIVLPLAVFLVWLALARGIRPLHQLEERIRARRPDDLSPIDTQVVPVEVSPLVNSVNDLFDRERQSLAAQRRFLADAAHQLKTPLAGLRMQADLALRAQASEAELKQSLKQISRASMNATRTVNQLLALARAEGSGQSLPKQRLNVAQTVMDVVKDALPRAMERGLDLGYEGLEANSPEAMMDGYPALLSELVRNLVDNAINYVPGTRERPGVITLRVTSDPIAQVLLLQVEDNGPGIPASERELVLQPFYRRLGQEADGSGLGLAIVAEIAKRHGAQLSIDEVHAKSAWPGVRFSLRFAMGR